MTSFQHSTLNHRHRGRHPGDDASFHSRWRPILQVGTGDLCWLYSRGYAKKSALKLVGDHYQLNVRQRMALQRSACSNVERAHRNAHRCPPEAISEQTVWVDGYNLLITIESALGNGILIEGRDGCIRDLASLHGTYRRVDETAAAVHLIGQVLEQLHPLQVAWFFDAPVSNSGRLCSFLRREAERKDWQWTVQTHNHVDALLAESTNCVITADSWILDRVSNWTHITPLVLQRIHPEPLVLAL